VGGGVQRIAGGGVVAPPPRAAATPAPTATPRRSPTQGAVRGVRAVVLGGASMLLAGTAHVVGDGDLPGLGVLTVLALFVGLVAAALTRRRCRLPLLLLVLGVEQLGLHLLLDTGAATACLPAAMPGHEGPPGCPSGLALPAAAADDHALGWPMLTAHVLATLLTAWLLACGEAVLWRVVDRVGRAAATLAAHWPASAPRPRPCPVLVPVGTCDAWEATAPRGPPAGRRAARC
jgi:hypothetical protein